MLGDDTDKRARATLTASRSTVVERAPDDPPIGATFDDAATRFESLGELGRGGMGRVVEAFDHALSRRVAIKNVLGDDAEALARFEREARITACLEHPSIVPLYDAGRDASGQPFYVMRRVDGKPLDAAAREAGGDRLALVPNVLAACDAVAFAHARSIVHRDLKPSNVLLGPFGETLVIDWGLAHMLDERGAGEVAGTPGFMPPEQERGERPDPRADVYALGATLRYVLAGGQPALPPDVPDDLRAIVDKALAADPAQRYPDAGALAADLRRFTTGRLVAAHRYRFRDQLRRFVRRHRAAVGVAAVATLVLAIVLAITLQRIVHERDLATAAEAREADRADELAIEQARLLLDTDPTLSVTLAKAVARGAHWRDAADIAAAARMRGVAWRLPASAKTWELDIAPDGRHAVSLGGDGVVRLYDLAQRETTTLAVLAHPVDRHQLTSIDLLDDDHLALFDGPALAIIDIHTHERRTITLVEPAVLTDRARGTLVWIDRGKRGWQLAPGADRPTPIDLPEPITRIWPAPDGAALAVAGEHTTWIVEHGTARRVLDRHVHKLAWNTERAELIAATEKGKIVRITPTDPPTVDELGSGAPLGLALAGGRLYVLGFSDLWSLAGVQRFPPGVTGVGVGVAHYERAVAGSTDGRIVVAGDTNTQVLVAPEHIDLVAADRSSSYVLAAGKDALWVWNLDDIMPRPFARLVDSLRIVGEYLMLMTNGGTTQWVALADRAETQGPELAFLSNVVASPSGMRAVAVAPNGAAFEIVPGTREATPIGTSVALAELIDEQHVAFVLRDGRIAVRDLATGALVERCPAHEGLRMLRVNANEVVVIYKGAIVRAGDDGRCVEAPIGGILGVHLDRAGRLYLATASALFVWPRGAVIAPHTMMPARITGFLVFDDTHLGLDTEDAGYLIDTAAPGAPRRTIHLGTLTNPTTTQLVWATASGQHTGVLAVPGADNAMLLDGTTGASWSIGMPVSFVAGDILIARRGDQIETLRLALPRSQLATLAALEQLTADHR